MGAAYDYDGNVLGEAQGDTAEEVLNRLKSTFPEAAEIRIRHGESPVAAEARRSRAELRKI